MERVSDMTSLARAAGVHTSDIYSMCVCVCVYYIHTHTAIYVCSYYRGHPFDGKEEFLNPACNIAGEWLASKRGNATK